MTLSRQSSGIKSVKRDFSSNNEPSGSKTTVVQRAPLRSTGVTNGRSLTDQEKRLKAIQDALKGTPDAGEPTIAGHKRAAPAVLTSNAKRRQLPSSWSEESTQSQRTSRTTSAASTNRRLGAVTEITVTPVHKSSERPAAVFLSQEQTHILKLVEQGESIFYTGSAGTGKSVLLREIIKVLKKKYAVSADAVAVTASTGIAACNIGGVTVHSFAGIGIGVDNEDVLASRVRKNKKAMSRWLRTKVLIIDEISMVDGDLFDKLARVGSMLRRDPRPFGGIQVVVTGDFFQLPPVPGKQKAVKFAFEADFWPQVVKKTFNLTKVFRQSDPEFVGMLNEMRFGTLTSQSIARFKSLSRPLEFNDGVAAAELFPRREDVERANNTRMHAIDTETHKFTAFDGGPLANTESGTKLLGNFMAPAEITLKIGAQVMLIKNLDDTLVNGSMGTVTEFTHPQDFALNPDDPFTEEQKPVSKSSSKPSSKAQAAPAAAGPKWPVVEFIVRQGSHTAKRRMMMSPETWKVELPNGEIQVSRTQIPLILAWAMSIHKSQGQTLERVKVDLGRIFEKGQAYVALSRATCLEGLQVLNFNPNKVMAHPTVIKWSATLETVPV